jgi:hypothetical protein
MGLFRPSRRAAIGHGDLPRSSAYFILTSVLALAPSLALSRETIQEGLAADTPTCPSGTLPHQDLTPRFRAFWCEGAGGSKEGPARLWTRSGRLLMSGSFRGDRRHGRWHWHTPSGRLLWLADWHEGVLADDAGIPASPAP